MFYRTEGYKMRKNNNMHESASRRGLLAVLGSILAAAAYARSVPEEVGAQVTSGDDSDVQRVSSPDGTIEVTVDVSSGVPTYSVAAGGTTYVEPSPIGFDFAGQEAFGTAVSGSGPKITVTGSESGTATETWDPEWGAFASVSEEYSFLTLGLAETTGPGRSANLEVRVFDDGLGFRVAFDSDFGEFAIASENTEFNFGGDYTAWWIRNYFVNPRYEQEYAESNLSDIPAGSRTTDPNGNTVREGAHLPLTMRAGDGTYLSVHESDLDDYASMSLASQSDAGTEQLAVELAPLPDGTKVSASARHVTPWRTIQISDSPGGLMESQLIPLLARDRDDSVLPTSDDGTVDTDWITPRTYVGIWWMMIAGSANWEYRSDSEISNDGNNPAKYIHGARTARMKRYMSFASQHGIDSVLVEGWNSGWDTYPGDGTGLGFGTDDSYPDYDVQTVVDYGASLPTPVEMTIHNESAGNVVNYEDAITNQEVFDDYESTGIRSIKNGYVSDPGLGFEGDGSTATHNHHCQTAVNHHRLAIRNAAAERQLLEIHEGIVPTGEIRTYPNVGAREVVKAQEYDGFDELAADVAREHHVVLPFTRMLAGPTSYQPGIFDVTFNDNSPDRIQSTRAKQLAMYPTYLGGLQMAADRIEAYVDPSLEVGEFVQAAAGELDGMITADVWRNCYGGQYVPIDPNRISTGDSVSFTVENVPSAGSYDVHFRYASDAEENIQDVIDNGNPEFTLVADGTERQVTPPFTDYWDSWEIHTVSVELTEGKNALAVELGPNDVGGMNLDSVAVGEAGAGSPVAATFGDVDPDKENYDAEPAFQFVEEVPATWDETVVVGAAIGDYSVVARRSGDTWYLGAMTDENARDISVSLDFLSSGSYDVTEYADAEGTDVTTDPTNVAISEFSVSAGDSVTFSLPASGGTAWKVVPGAESAPVVDSLSASEVETSDSDAEFDVSWGVSDPDGDLSSLELLLVQDADGTIEDSVTVSVSGGSAVGTSRLVAADDDGSGNDYTVEATVTDGAGNTRTDTVSVSETDDTNAAPTASIDGVTDNSNPRWERYEVDWSAGDTDGNLDAVVVELLESGGTVLDAATTDVSGSSATGVDDVEAKNATATDIVVSATDTDGATGSDSRRV